MVLKLWPLSAIASEFGGTDINFMPWQLLSHMEHFRGHNGVPFLSAVALLP